MQIAAIKMGMTIEKAARCSGTGRSTMRKLAEWKKIPVLKVGRKAIIRSDTQIHITLGQVILERICMISFSKDLILSK